MGKSFPEFAIFWVAQPPQNFYVPKMFEHNINALVMWTDNMRLWLQ